MADHTPTTQSVVVPIEPTGAMIEAAANAPFSDARKATTNVYDRRIQTVADMLRAGIAAAPAPSSLAGGEVCDLSDAIDQFISDAIANSAVEVNGDDTIQWCKPALEQTLVSSLAGCGYRIAALSPEAPRGTSTATPGGWLIKDHADGWFWTPTKIAAVAALTEGHKVYSISRGEYEGAPFTDKGAEERYITDAYELSPEAPVREGVEEAMDAIREALRWSQAYAPNKAVKDALAKGREAVPILVAALTPPP